MQLDPALLTTLRVGLALLFGSAALHKLADLRAFRAALVEYRIVPERAAAAAAGGLAFAEVAVAAALLVPRLGQAAALAAAALLALGSRPICPDFVHTVHRPFFLASIASFRHPFAQI